MCLDISPPGLKWLDTRASSFGVSGISLHQGLSRLRADPLSRRLDLSSGSLPGSSGLSFPTLIRHTGTKYCTASVLVSLNKKRLTVQDLSSSRHRVVQPHFLETSGQFFSIEPWFRVEGDQGRTRTAIRKKAA